MRRVQNDLIIVVASMAVATSLAASPRAQAQDMTGTAAVSTESTNIETGFSLANDAIPIGNYGDWNDGGDCLGFSRMAIWWFEHKATLGPLPRGLDQVLRIHLFVLLVEQRANTVGKVYPFSDPTIGQSLLDQLVITRKPQLLGIVGPGKDGHSVVAFAFSNGAFQCYDPNYPNNTVVVPWNPTTGFGKYSLAGGASFDDPYYSHLEGVTVTGGGLHLLSDEVMMQLWKGAANAQLQAEEYGKVTAKIVAKGDGYWIEGKLAEPPGDSKKINPPRRAVVYLSATEPAIGVFPADKSGHFSGALSAKSVGKATKLMVESQTHDAHGLGILAGIGLVKVPGKHEEPKKGAGKDDALADIEPWIVKMCAKTYKEDTGQDLAASAQTSSAKIFEAFKSAHATHTEGTAPKGAYVFYETKIVVSNGNGTALGPGADGKPDIAISLSSLGTPIGWVATNPPAKKPV
ncbi:MAG TPA: hypothetical protein VFF73_10910, partial [Planctomycetota bacterium]|nr:hypothetical protein [Planctomycetota bacterium]